VGPSGNVATFGLRDRSQCLLVLKLLLEEALPLPFGKGTDAQCAIGSGAKPRSKQCVKPLDEGLPINMQVDDGHQTAESFITLRAIYAGRLLVYAAEDTQMPVQVEYEREAGHELSTGTFQSDLIQFGGRRRG